MLQPLHPKTIVAICLLKAGRENKKISFSDIAQVLVHTQKIVGPLGTLSKKGGKLFYSEDVNYILSQWHQGGWIKANDTENIKLLPSSYRICLKTIAEECSVNLERLFSSNSEFNMSLGLRLEDIFYAFTKGEVENNLSI